MPKTPRTIAPTELAPELLFRACNPSELDFATTADLPDLVNAFGQARAAEAIHFGMAVARPGYNLFVLGDHGNGRHWLANRLLTENAKSAGTPDDWVYVFNFDEPRKPRALRLPAGRGVVLRNEMLKFASELGPTIAAAFESDQYRLRVDAMQEDFKRRREAAVQSLGEEATKNSIGLLRTPDGFTFVPVKGEEPMDPEEFAKLPEQERARITADLERFSARLQEIMKQIQIWQRDLLRRVRDTSRETLKDSVSHLIEELKQRYVDLPDVVGFFDAALQDLIESGESLREQPGKDRESDDIGLTGAFAPHRYHVNLLVDNSALHGAPVIHEDNPSHHNIAGRVDQVAQMGTLVTNFMLIKAGALHRANGGYLVLDAAKVLAQPYAWEGLKRALRAGKIQIESLGQVYGLISTLSLEPEPIPIKLKVVLVGERLLYYLLSDYDPDFQELFKVAADFEVDVPRDGGNTRLFAQLIATLARANHIKPLDGLAVGRVIEHAARIAGDAQRLTTHTRRITDLLREAEHFATQGGRDLVTRADVEQALTARVRRADRLRVRHQESIIENVRMIDTAGLREGQINGLAAMTLGDHVFAHPARITATVRLGEGDVIDIEREVELGGALHSKGVMILGAFLGARFSRAMPLSLTASLVFEQSYGPVEGDSASLAELCALLSTLASVPIRQSLAVTGSVNQHGQVQAIGAVNEKIEGFFDICSVRGLTGDQGVLIPKSNVRHLMLREDVVRAARDGMFHVYAVADVDEAMELLTGIPAGVPDEGGVIPEGSINHRVASQIAELSAQRQSYIGVGNHGGKEK